MVKLKSLIKLFVPPIFGVLINWIKGTQYTFEHIFSNFEKAYAASGQKEKHLSSDLDTKYIENYSTNYKHFDAKDIIVPILLLNHQGSRINILDIGGGIFPIFNYLSDEDKKRVTCYVLERPEFVKKMYSSSNKSKLDKNLVYIDSFDLIPSNMHFEITYFGSSIQYFPDYENMFVDLMKYRSKFFVISYSVFTTLESNIFVLQKNSYPSIFPNMFISEKKFDQFMVSLQYKKVYSFTHKNEINFHRTLPSDKYRFKSFIFQLSQN